MTSYYSNGKLLLTGEYLVLESAQALALPTKFGQYLNIKEGTNKSIHWKSYDADGTLWFSSELILDKVKENSPFKSLDIHQKLKLLLTEAKVLNPNFLNENKGYIVEAKLTFPRNWGLGSSSTLINNVAQWAKVDAFKLAASTFGGSGYDIACAQNDHPIIYQLTADGPMTTEVNFKPPFHEDLYFLYLGEKQDSREGIAEFYRNKGAIKKEIKQINEITKTMVNCKSLDLFMELMEEHESIISSVIKKTKVKEQLFKDFEGSIKSLGAWGGDFVMIASKNNPTDYYRSKGYKTLFSYNDLILN